MPESKHITISYLDYDSVDHLSPADRRLMHAAIDATLTAYAPYSHFSVGAAVLLDDGTIVTGSNQENIAYPSGLCAERTALFAAGAQHADKAAEALAIVGRRADGVLVEASPCGACRQVMSEMQMRSGRPLRVLMYTTTGGVRIVDDVQSLLPFSFEM